MIEISEVMLIALAVGGIILGTIIGVGSTRDYRKILDRDYQDKHRTLDQKIRKEIMNEWTHGWDDAYKHAGVELRKMHIWLREHGYESDEVDSWWKTYSEEHEIKSR